MQCDKPQQHTATASLRDTAPSIQKMGDRVHPVTLKGEDFASEDISTRSMGERIHPVTVKSSDYSSEDISPRGRADRVYPRAPPAPFEPLSPSGRSDVTGGFSQGTSNYHHPLIKAYTAPPAFLSPPHPPPTVVGRPPLKSQRKLHRNGGCCCCLIVFFSILLFLVVAVGILVLVLWLVYNPKLPHYTVQDAQIVKLNVNSRNGSSTVGQPLQNPVLNTDILFTVQARNPNHKIGISYHQIRIDGTYQGTSVGQCNIPGFYQSVDNTTTLTAELRVTNSQLTDSEGTALQTDIDNNDIGLLGRVDVKVGVKIGGWTTPHVWIHVGCNIQVSPPTSPQGAKLLSKTCSLKWK